MTPIDRANRAQARAADPGAQIFVEANAGSGKTRVLVDRVARLLLGGAEPDRILCLTYTKAAAGEMKSRLFARLGEWSILPDHELKDTLKKIGGSRPDDLAKARTLFARALETPGGLAVQTIHAFCESLLKRFPLEAGVPPGFDIADDQATLALVAEARRDVLLASREDPALTRALAVITARGADRLDHVFRLIRDNRHALSDLFRTQGLEAVISGQYAAFGLEDGIQPDAILAAGWAAAPVAALHSALPAIREGSVNDQKRAALLHAALTASTPEAACEAGFAVYFTGGGEKKTVDTLVTQAVSKPYPQVLDLLTEEQARMEEVRDRVRLARSIEGAAAVLRFAEAFTQAYAARLTAARKLDFADLVDRAARLLADSDAAQWVRYKMDGGVDHILVDETQDTGPDQWRVIDQLAEAFYTPDPDRGIRTLFCVGDEKQSIYSFQGADPKAFIARGRQLVEDSLAARLDHDRPEMSVSFRSGPEILKAVDRAFAPEQALGEIRAAQAAPEVKFAGPLNDNEDAVGFAPAPDAFVAYHPHEAARTAAPGVVEIWPPVPVSPKLEDEDPTGPVDRENRSSSRARLAAMVAGEIRRILEAGEPVWQEVETEAGRHLVQRAARPEDIMVLVRQRKPGFFDELIRQLKLNNIPVAGADRMTLRDQLAVQDLLGVARVALNPRDDLALAEVLKSPFFHPAGADPVITEEVLFELAHGRKGTLWAALRGSENPSLAEAREALRAARARVGTAGVYGFFSEFLTETSASGESRFRRLLARLGEEARDPVDEFLGRALAHEQDRAPSLTQFVAEMRGDGGTIKREMEDARGEVRVMTVHASKGLEAPIVILPDTTQSPRARSEGGLMVHKTHGIVWLGAKGQEPAELNALRAEEEAAGEGEYTRLLYVALTRARDRLLVCGWGNGAAPGKVAERSWHDRLSKLWQGEGWTEIDTPVRGEDGEVLKGRRLGQAPAGMEREAETVTRLDLPAWALQPAAPEAAPPRPAAPSRLVEDGEPPVLSPLLGGDTDRFRRGNLIHKLLQTLPDLDPRDRAGAAERYLARQSGLDPKDAAQIASETLAVLDHADFAPLFAPGSRAEVAIAGTVAGMAVRGQIDRLVVTPGKVMIIDYKTNRPPPDTVAGVAPVYLAQMAAYRALLQSLHPDRPVRCALLWTDGPRLMELPGGVLEAALPGRGEP